MRRSYYSILNITKSSIKAYYRGARTRACCVVTEAPAVGHDYERHGLSGTDREIGEACLLPVPRSGREKLVFTAAGSLDKTGKSGIIKSGSKKRDGK